MKGFSSNGDMDIVNAHLFFWLYFTSPQLVQDGIYN